MAQYNLNNNWSDSNLPDWVGDIDLNGFPAQINDIVKLATAYNLDPDNNPEP